MHSEARHTSLMRDVTQTHSFSSQTTPSLGKVSKKTFEKKKHNFSVENNPTLSNFAWNPVKKAKNMLGTQGEGRGKKFILICYSETIFISITEVLLAKY